LLILCHRYCTIIREVKISFKALCSANWNGSQCPMLAKRRFRNGIEALRFTARMFGLAMKFAMRIPGSSRPVLPL
jgi:hypothetical protein